MIQKCIHKTLERNLSLELYSSPSSRFTPITIGSREVKLLGEVVPIVYTDFIIEILKVNLIRKLIVATIILDLLIIVLLLALCLIVIVVVIVLVLVTSIILVIVVVLIGIRILSVVILLLLLLPICIILLIGILFLVG